MRIGGVSSKDNTSDILTKVRQPDLHHNTNTYTNPLFPRSTTTYTDNATNKQHHIPHESMNSTHPHPLLTPNTHPHQQRTYATWIGIGARQVKVSWWESRVFKMKESYLRVKLAKSWRNPSAQSWGHTSKSLISKIGRRMSITGVISPR
jgi:hypothetical protein